MKFKFSTLLMIPLLAMSCCNGQTEQAIELPPISKAGVETVVDGKFTPELMHLLGKVSDPQVSPDGKKILYGVAYTSIEQNRSVRQLFVMNIDGTGNRKITDSPKSCGNARWYEGGEKIVYLAEGQMYMMNADGGAAVVVSNLEGGMSAFEFSPDQSKVLYVAEVQSAIRPVDEHPDLDKSTGRHIKDLMYRHWDHFVETIPHTYVADFTGRLGKGRDLLDGAPYELPTLPWSGLEQLSWTPDGKYIAYSCRKLTGKEYAFSTNTDIYLYEVATGKARNLTEGMLGYDTDPVFSPDGKYLAWISMERPGYEADKQRLFIIDMATMAKKELTAGFKYNVTTPSWKSTSDGIYFTSLVNALQGVFVADLNGSIKRITADDMWFDFGAVTEAGDRLISTYSSMDMPSEIVSISLKDGAVKQLSQENTGLLAAVKKNKTEERWLTTVDGKKMHTWVVFPPEFDPNKKYPAILMCNGGPQSTLSQGWSTRWNYRLMANQGYIVVLPNRRGTTAFGQEWCEQISGDYIGLNMQDYLTAARELKKEPYVGKMGAAGASYGGYSIYYLAGIHNGMFDAFLSHAGIFNQEQMYMMTEEMWFPTWDNGGAPWDDNKVARRHYDNSPHKLIKKWNTPIMITHGEMDYRVPVEQGMAAFNAAQMMGVPSEMLLFPDENHWILKPQNAVHWQRAYFAWFDKWLKK